MEGQAVKCQLARELIHYYTRPRGHAVHIAMLIAMLIFSCPLHPHHYCTELIHPSPLFAQHKLTLPALVLPLVRRNLPQHMQTRHFHSAANQGCRWGHLHATPRSLQNATLSRTTASSQSVEGRQRYHGVCGLGELRLRSKGRSLGAYV